MNNLSPTILIRNKNIGVFRHQMKIHHESRNCIEVIENMPMDVKIMITPQKTLEIIDYDKVSESELKTQIIKNFLSIKFLMIITSFFVNKKLLPTHYKKKNVDQKINYKFSCFQPYLANFFLTSELPKIKILSFNNFFDTDIKMSKSKLDFYYFNQLYMYVENRNKEKFWTNIHFFYNLFNLQKSTFQKIFHVCLKIRNESEPIYFSNIVCKDKFVNVLKKRLRKKSPQLPNCYKIRISTFQQIWNFFPEIKLLPNFFSLSNLVLLKKERLSSVYYTFSIARLDQIIEQCFFLDSLVSKSQIEFAVSRNNVINSAFDRVNLFSIFPCSQKICNSKRVESFYSNSFYTSMNTYSKIYILNRIILSNNAFQIFSKKEINKIISAIKGQYTYDILDFYLST